MAISDSPINRVPRGLLGFVDVKAMGKNPARLSDSVAPVLDLTALYMTDGLRQQVEAGAPVDFIVAGTWQPKYVVPANKIWLVRSIATVCNTVAAANNIQFLHAVNQNGLAYPDGFRWTGIPSPVWTTGDVPVWADFFNPTPLVLRGGEAVGWYGIRNAAVQAARMQLSYLEVDA